MQKRLGVADRARLALSTSMNRLLEDLLKVMTLERLELDLFRGESRDIGSPQVFGGQVLGQALMAATATVEDRAVHSLHAYFLRRGDFNSPIVYEVDRARDGNHFSTRRVVAIQHGAQIFNMSASFQVAEDRARSPARRCRDVPPPEALPIWRRITAILPDSCRRACAACSSKSGRSNFVRCSRRSFSSRRKSAAAQAHLVPRGRPRCPTMRRCIAACWPTCPISICSTPP